MFLKLLFRIIELAVNESGDNSVIKQYVLKNFDKFNLNAQAYLVLGVMAEENDKDDFALKLYAKGLESDPDELQLLNNYIWASLQTGNYNKDELILKCERVVKLYPENTQVLDTCSVVFNRFGLFTKTREILRKNPVLMRLDPRLYLRLAEAYEGLGQRAKAEENYQDAIAARRSNEKIKEQVRAGLKRVKENLKD